MKSWLRYSICILLGLGGGTAYAVHQVRSDYAVKQVIAMDRGAPIPIRARPTPPTLTRAKVALNGLLALPAKEAMYFISRTDSDGAAAQWQMHLHRQRW